MGNYALGAIGAAVTWRTIRNQFTDDDVNHMKDVFGEKFDLSNCTCHVAKQATDLERN